VKLASSVVSQRQLNQSGSHRPNLRKILYVIHNILMLAFPNSQLLDVTGPLQMFVAAN